MTAAVLFLSIAVLAAIFVGLLARRFRAEMHRRLELERSRIAMDLHDELGSGLGSIGILAGLAAEPDLDEKSRRDLTDRIASGADDLSTALTDIVWALRPESNSVAALAAHLVERAARIFQRDDTTLVTRMPESWPPTSLSLGVRLGLQAIAVEAMHNVARHAGARRVEIGFSPAGQQWKLWVEDDGHGMSAPVEGTSSARGRGLAIMRRRAEEIGAAITWTAQETGGTRVEIEFDSRSSRRGPRPDEAVTLRTHHPPRRLHASRETALYGRESELSQLEALFHEAQVARGRVVLIEGEAGIGKTRLVDEFAAHLRREEVAVRFLYGSFPPGGAATAVNGFAHAYREHLGDARLEAILGDYLADTPALVPGFAALLRGLAPPRGAAVLTKDAVHTLFANLTRALAAEIPTIVVIDDLHFAPEEARALFIALARTIPAHRVLLAGTMRPEMLPDWSANFARLAHTAHINVPRLDLASREQLVRDALQSAPLAPQLVAEISSRSDGNPFFVLELVREMRDSGRLARGPGGTLTVSTIDAWPVSGRIMDTIAARMTNLQSEDRDLLELASCWGFEFDPRLIAAAAGGDVSETLQRLTHMEREYRLVRQLDSTFVFDHHQIQEVLHERLFAPLRGHYHTALAAACERQERIAERDLRVGDGPVAVQLAGHFLAGGQGEHALRYLETALDHLGASHARAASVKLAERALAVPGLLSGKERIRILLRLNADLEAGAHFEASRAALMEALSLAESLGDRGIQGEMYRRLGINTSRGGRVVEALREFEKGLELVVEAGDLEAEVSISGSVAMALRLLGRYEESRRIAERMLAQARQAGDRAGETHALAALGSVVMRMGEPEGGLALHREELAIAETLPDKTLELRALTDLATTLSDSHRLEEARTHLDRLLTLARKTGNRNFELFAWLRRSDVALKGGQYDEVCSILQTALEMAEATGSRGEQYYAHLGLLQAHLAAGRIALAMEHEPQAKALAVERGSTVQEEEVLYYTAIALCQLGDMDLARASLAESLSMAHAAKADREADTLWRLATVHEQADDFAGAERCYREGLDRASRLNQQEERACLLAGLGGLLLDQGSNPEARECLETAISLAREFHQPGAEALALTHLARLPGGSAEAAATTLAACEPRLPRWEAMQAHFVLWKADGDRQQLEAAHRMLHELLEHSPEIYRPGMLTNVALHRHIEEEWNKVQPTSSL